MARPPPTSTLFPYTTLFRSEVIRPAMETSRASESAARRVLARAEMGMKFSALANTRDRKSTRLNSSHSQISYAVFCLKKKNKTEAFDEEIATSEDDDHDYLY